MICYWKDADFSVLKEPTSVINKKKKRHGGGVASTLVGAFDTETTTVEIGEKKYAFMYVWQFAVNDMAVYGRTWDDFREFLLNLRSDLQLSVDYKLIVYVHNLKYDFQFFKNEVNLEGDFLARDARTIIKNTVNDVFEFRDSGCYTEEPLAMMGAEIGYHKLDGLLYDYTKIRHAYTPLTDEELEYCEHDVLILTKYYRREAEKYGGVKNIPITATRRVKRLILENMRRLRKSEIGMIASKQLRSDKKQDAEMLDLLRKSFFGGYTYSNVFYRNRAVSDVTGIDISSCYPAQCIMHKFPMGKFEPLPLPENVEELRTKKIYSNKAMLITFRCESMKTLYPGVGFLPSNIKNLWERSKPDPKNIKSKKLLTTDVPITMTLTDVDFTLLTRFYSCKGLKILSVVGCVYGTLPKYIIDTIVDLYKRKNQLKKRNEEIKKVRQLTYAEEAEYSLVKSMLNRIYGIFVQDPVRTNYEYSAEKGKVLPNGENVSEKFEGVLYQWGVWIVAWARYELLNIFTAVGISEKKYKNNVLHCDTDSIYFTGNHDDVIERYNVYTVKRIEAACKMWQIDPTDMQGMGVLSKERYKKLKTLGLKQYAYIDDKNRFDYHCSRLTRPDYIYDDDGYLIMNKGMNFFDQFETSEEKLNAFSTTMYIPKENAKIHQNIYVDNPEGETIVVKDYNEKIEQVKVRSYVVIDYDCFDPTKQEELLLQVEDDRLEFIMKRFI